MRRNRVFLIALVAIGFLFLGTRGARADAADCTLVFGVNGTFVPGTPGECQVSPSSTALSGIVALDETLHLLNGAVITVGVGSSLTLNLTNGGGLIMDAGSMIDGGNRTCFGTDGAGSPITINATGDIDVKGPGPGGTPKAIIRSNGCSGGAIAITTDSTHNINIDGTVESVGTASGTGATQRPGGGTITIVAGCELTVSDTGLVRSFGFDPGADLVHLEGCTVNINGVVESTVSGGGGHALPNNPANHCNLDTVAHPTFGPLNNGAYTTCVEIWGNTVTIDNTGTHNGEVNAGGPRTDGPPRKGWIDIFGRGDITIIADTVGAYAVHANANAATNSYAGWINVKSQLGKVVTKALVAGDTGRAIQANTSGGGGSFGGDIIVQAGGAAPNGEVDFTADSIQAIGAANGAGGHISGQSFKDDVLGILFGELNASGGPPLGSVTLRACGTANYTGTSTPAASQFSGVDCLLDPTFPLVPHWYTGQTVEQFFASRADCDTRCLPSRGSKSGIKFNDHNGNGVRDAGDEGLNGWVIHLWGTETSGATVHPPTQTTHTATGADLTCPPGDGCYFFGGLNPGTYHVCEELQTPGWTQTFPGPGFSCAGADPNGDNPNPGPNGYTFTITAVGENHTGNDFGNHTTITCPEDPNRAAQLTRTVDKSKPNLSGGGVAGNPKNYWLVQAAYNDAKAAAQAEVIGLFANTSENLLLDGTKSLTITQCTVARVTGAAGSPVWNITSTGKLTIIGPDSVGGSIGWRVAGNGGHNLKSIRANGASQYGVLITSNGNSVSWNDVSGNGPGAGISVTGNTNTLKGGTVGPNNGDGVQLVGNTNNLSGSNILSNTGNGVLVSGATNTVKSNGRVNLNGLNGIFVTGSGNTVSSNSSESNKGNTLSGIKVPGMNNQLTDNKMFSNHGDGFNVFGTLNRLKSNSGTNNTPWQFNIGAGNTDQGSNKANGNPCVFLGGIAKQC